MVVFREVGPTMMETVIAANAGGSAPFCHRATVAADALASASAIVDRESAKEALDLSEQHLAALEPYGAPADQVVACLRVIADVAGYAWSGTDVVHLGEELGEQLQRLLSVTGNRWETIAKARDTLIRAIEVRDAHRGTAN